MRKIPLNKGKNGKFALVSDESYEQVIVHNWYLDSRGYARTNINKVPITMHRFLLEAQPGQEIDHKNRDKLDNQLDNIRFCTHQENMFNRDKWHIPSAKITGSITFNQKCNKYYARAQFDNKRTSLGGFLTRVEALVAIKKFKQTLEI